MKKILFAIALVALAACSKNSAPLTINSDEIRFNIGFANQTKATSTAFETGDKISLYAVEYDGETQMPLQVGGNFLNNEPLTYNGTTWAGTRTLYWSTKSCDFYALYPYQSDIKSIESYPFEIISNQDGDGYEESDLLFAYAEKVQKSDGAVNLQFKHMMSKLVVTVTKGSKFEGEIPDDIVTHIYNTNVDCHVNFTTGSVEKDAFGAKKTITMKKISNERFEAVVVPQNLEKKTPLVELTMGGIAYLLEYSLSFRPGYVYKVNVTLNTSPDQEQIEISIDPDINDWN